MIFREDAIEAVKSMQTYKLFERDDMLLIDKAEVMEGLTALPSAEPERKKGKWEKCDMDKWVNGALKCNKCGKGYHLPHEVHLFDWNFCPNCGTQMER